MIAVETACSRASARARQSARRFSVFPAGEDPARSGSTLTGASKIRCYRASASTTIAREPWMLNPPLRGGQDAPVLSRTPRPKCSSARTLEPARGSAARALLRLVDPQRPATEVGAVEGLD